MLTLTGAEEIRAHVGRPLGVSGWKAVSQETVDRFAEISGDRQFIHVDAEAAARTQFGGTVAHGLFTLSLGAAFTAQIFRVEGFAFAVNYGFNRVRFPAPLRTGSKVRMRATLLRADTVPGGIEIVSEQTFESDRSDRPVCVAELVLRFYDSRPGARAPVGQRGN